MQASPLSATSTNLAFVLLFVADPATSVGFYSRVFAVEPVEQSPTFAMFALPSGLNLGLWKRATAEPAISAQPGASELSLVEPEIDRFHADWSAHGIPILQPPTDMDFGRTFVALDPDGHRLRVFWPAAEPQQHD
jgi:catechol 2,3-dioxygenase-like lactoylglutathione lyase family enzyme